MILLQTDSKIKNCIYCVTIFFFFCYVTTFYQFYKYYQNLKEEISWSSSEDYLLHSKVFVYFSIKKKKHSLNSRILINLDTRPVLTLFKSDLNNV